jgi:hypothetical protein
MILMINPNVFDDELNCLDICVFDDNQLENYINKLWDKTISYSSIKVNSKTIFLKIGQKEFLFKNSNEVFYKTLCYGKIVWINKRYFD